MMLAKGQSVPQGTAQAGDVLASKTFMAGGSFAKKTGTIPDFTDVSPQHAAYQAGIPTEVRIVVPTGYYVQGQPTYPLFVYDGNFTAGNIAQGQSIFGLNGSYTSDADATAADIRAGKTAYVNGVKITGTATF